MEESTGMKESSGIPESTDKHESVETAATGDPHAAGGRSVPGWKGWVLSILVAVILSVTAMLLLGGSGVFRSDSAIKAGAGGVGTGAGSNCCPPADAGK